MYICMYVYVCIYVLGPVLFVGLHVRHLALIGLFIKFLNIEQFFSQFYFCRNFTFFTVLHIFALVTFT